MKTENIASGDVIWTNNDDLLADENCLSVIGNCQISSILSNLDASGDKIENRNENPPHSDHDDAENGDLKSTVNYVVLKESSGDRSETVKKSSSFANGANNFEDMLYFVCNLCPFLCTKNSKITEHLENAHKTKTVRKLAHLKCPACPNVFFHKMSLRSHLIHDHGVGNSDINLIIQAVVYYANKAKSSENKKVKLESSFVVESASKKADVEQSKTVHLPKVEIIQTKAKKIFNSMMNQQTITKLIGSNKLHTCAVPMCKVTLQSADNMNYHIKCHQENGFICLVCNETFLSWKQLSSHLWRLHKIDMELYSCDKCNYKSVSLAKLNNIHKLIHGDVKAYVCNVCKKAFKNSKQLGNHKNTHKSNYDRVKFVCETCSKTFSDRRQLRIHMSVVHEKIKPYLCNYCGYKGSSRSALKMHIRQHTGEKPFVCDACSYATSDHNSLRRHKLRHTGQKPYKCSFCSYACIQSSTYKVHIKTKHPGQEKDLMFTCQDCQFRTVNKEMYVAHMITVHDQKPQS
ncbi:zinc finger protein 91 [Asbolus verrucosus]|uniref:Zinc finger protein 91 n=1 Tax=Asbolus verrucosus TaxID=1661398 RepID=A0A482W3U3_ASBVE|nr:zinc finger protein 91 [Asbolus verrucosus]